MGMCFACLLFGVVMCLVLPALVSLPARGCMCLGKSKRMRVCCTPAFGCLHVLVLLALVFLTRAWVYVLRGVHAHARELSVQAFG
jgi:hypothetical protein